MTKKTDIFIALIPTVILGSLLFGLRASAVIVISVASCLIIRYGYLIYTKKTKTIFDGNSALTGLFLALMIPPSSTPWLVVIGAALAISLFLRFNIHPTFAALCAKVGMFVVFPFRMNTWTEPLQGISGLRVDASAWQTPLTAMKSDGFILDWALFNDALLGGTIGNLGETCSAALLIGGIYLLARKIITWHIPVTFIGTLFLLGFVFGFTLVPLYSLMLGGLFYYAFFIAVLAMELNAKDKLIMGFGCGIFTFIIRLTPFPEAAFIGVFVICLIMKLLILRRCKKAV
jgi:electron transport complex protein RnfD